MGPIGNAHVGVSERPRSAAARKAVAVGGSLIGSGGLDWRINKFSRVLFCCCDDFTFVGFVVLTYELVRVKLNTTLSLVHVYATRK